MGHHLIRLDIIAGARPNFMKIAPIIDAINYIASERIHFRLIHTGQHYDKKMSGSFFEELGIPDPDINLGAGGGTQAQQTAAIMVGYENVLLNKEKPDYCLVVGDVTSTMACSIVAKKLNIKVLHVEAGIRSNDLGMPEEINRMVTDSITDYFYTTSGVANDNLKQLGIPANRIAYVGNTMIDTLVKNLPILRKPEEFDTYKLEKGKYFVLTLHRPANVDGENKLKNLLNEIIKNNRSLPIIFPVHPRTSKVIKEMGFDSSKLHIVEPLGYLEFNYLVKNAMAVITDSGGITEETTYLGIPCLTLRDNTERPETISIGTNELLGSDPKNIEPALFKLFEGKWKKGEIPHLWDGNTAGRIINHLLSLNE